MTNADFDLIEERIEVVLPRVFCKFMRRFRTSPRRVLINYGGHTLPCNAELFAIEQLRFRAGPFDCYELQPELASRRFVVIGGDGCGNYFFMPGDDAESDELWLWLHDPYDGFSLATSDNSFHSGLTQYFRTRSRWKFFGDTTQWRMGKQRDPFRAASGLYVASTDHPVRAIFDPIPLDAWVNAIDRQPVLELDENHYATNPFSGEEVTFRRWPGRARLTLDEQPYYVHYEHGALAFGENPPQAVRALATEIAESFDARVWEPKRSRRLW